MKQFEILVKTFAGSKGFIVKPTSNDEDALYEIWDGDNHLFTLECCMDENGRSLRLTDKFSDNKVYPGLIKALSDIIYKNNDEDFSTRRSASPWL